MRSFTVRLGLLAAGLAMVAAPALAGQRPNDTSPPPHGDRGSSADRPSGGGGGGDRGGNAGGGATTVGSSGSVAGSSGSSNSSPSGGAMSTPSSGMADRGVREAAPQRRTGGGEHQGGGRAVPRGSGSAAPSTTTAAPSGAPRGRTSAREGDNSAGVNQGQEIPGWARPRGNRPATGVAVERTTPVPGRGNIFVYDPYGYGYYGGAYRPFGYGYGGYGLGLGLGYGWYDPWYGFGDPFGYGYGYGGGYDYGGYGYSSQGRYSAVDQGKLRLKIKPRQAKVYVDGYFVGLVDQFDGAFQKLSLNAGRHRVEIKADGYETAEFDVLINPDATVTYQGDLKKIQ